ncbi:MAG: ROK family protein [Firmicutes bacterium]|nr:ROK family protein [Bacillota bacterium]HPU00636.1 ROK family protein [Bacillota bacterium]
MERKVYAIGDVGGTKTLLLLVDGDRQVLWRQRLRTPAGSPPEVVVETIDEALSQGQREIGLDRRHLAGVGIGIAALLDFDEGVIYESPNLHWHEPIPFRRMMQECFPCPVYIDNDANAAVLGEATYGAAQGHRYAAYITISTGIGGGLYLDGKVYRGSRGFAGEIGHIKRFGKGRRCGCGGEDCLEAWASGEAMARSARELWDESDPSIGPLNTAVVFDLAAAGNPLARFIIERAIEDIGTSLANLVTLLNLSCLVIGGGVAQNRSDFIAQLRDIINRAAIAPSVKVTRVEVVPARLGAEAGAWGMFAMMQASEC